MSLIADFLAKVETVHKTGIAREHAYRPALHDLLQALGDDITPVNDPAKSKVGAPDFIVLQDGIAIGHVEAKDIDIALQGMKGPNKEQQDRYRAALPNLVYTNCLDWDFYRDGELVASVSIADLLMGIQPKPDQYQTLENLLREFAAERPQTITAPKELAVRMAGKAQLIKDVLSNTLRDDKDRQTDLAKQYEAFKENLIHDITPEDFADIYAETIAYGMFAARLHDTTLDTFSRQEALDLLPKSNPFLRSLFTYVAGYDLDDRIAWIIDDLARVFQACDVAKLMEGFGKLTGQNDPFLHFYETFLAAYNPAKRKARGVWYTPEPVVNFIVRAVDEVLQSEFGLPDGLADTSKVTIDWDTGQRARTQKGDFRKDGKNIIEKRSVHRVQILDPATGTGTFLAEVIKQIAPKVQGVAPGMWSQYIEQDLIPRLHGFELLMASYAMCHMKLDMILTELGYQPTKEPPRLSVFLTNSLEEGEPANQTLPFTQWLSREAKGANTIKRDMPIMCVVGNPPYLGEGGLSEGWLGELMDDYKKEPGGIVKLQERNPKWLNDLYVKFIRMSSHLIEKNGEGILGFITNHGYLDNPTFRGMRWHLLTTFDRIWVLDLHGNAKKKEVSPDGSPDKNVFDIQQGVAILICVMNQNSGDKIAKVMHGHVWGQRSLKYKFLESRSITDSIFIETQPKAPNYFFPPHDYELEAQYESGFNIKDFFQVSVLGFQTHRDKFAVAETKNEIERRLDDMLDESLTDAEFHRRYGTKNNRDWSLEKQRRALSHDKRRNEALTKCLYRPFDERWCHLSYRMMDYPRTEIVQHVLNRENICLLASRQLATQGYRHVLVTNLPAESCAISLKTKEQNQVLPLYLYPDEQDLDQTRRVNFDPKLFANLQKLAKHPKHGMPDEIQIFDYIYGVLHCPAYRETYAEFLKVDFPRIPWPSSPDEFWDVSAKGAQLRNLHLMEPAAIGQTPYPFTGEGDNVVDKPRFENDKVWINKTQCFADVPEVSWSFYIGGYQPAQKWLKDRKARALSFDDVKHYQRILKILAGTDRIMKTITMEIHKS
ncbi:N-6 DNA Methylase [Labrenzia sp. THAF82]|uniref:type ISP restriction/modification enzyme n=1 Tax=Labrenzia sp. THAF82 TaxID=2587861 RepID=UPI001269417C|nr:type ISP restriction/modification enzyme [Labrenzia sp. THAF82]QFT29543.1 N-6 DNA Methylase [Labrenzia sp. THAF82]